LDGLNAFPPDVPKDRVEIMRKAFAETLQDPALQAEAAKMKMDMTYRPPDDLTRLVADLYDTAPALIATSEEARAEFAGRLDRCAQHTDLLCRPRESGTTR